jgi:hypothetical protein
VTFVFIYLCWLVYMRDMYHASENSGKQSYENTWYKLS